MTYHVVITKSVLKTLEKINDPDYTKIKNSILALATNPRPNGYIKLKGREGYRIRQGNILTVSVIALGHRKDIYM